MRLPTRSATEPQSDPDKKNTALCNMTGNATSPGLSCKSFWRYVGNKPPIE